MNIRCESFEYFLLAGIATFSFSYFVLRSIVYDNFIWIIIFPLLCISYILLFSDRFTFKDFNLLDSMVFIYLLFGILMTILGLFIGNYKTVVVQVFIHYYLPSIIYFIS